MHILPNVLAEMTQYIINQPNLLHEWSILQTWGVKITRLDSTTNVAGVSDHSRLCYLNPSWIETSWLSSYLTIWSHSEDNFHLHPHSWNLDVKQAPWAMIDYKLCKLFQAAGFLLWSWREGNSAHNTRAVGLLDFAISDATFIYAAQRKS